MIQIILMQRELDDAIVFAEKDSTETSTVELCGHGLKIKRRNCENFVNSHRYLSTKVSECLSVTSATGGKSVTSLNHSHRP